MSVAERPEITTDRLRLRPPRVEDAPAIAALANDWEVVKNTGRMPFPYAEEDAREWIARAAGPNDRSETSFVIDAGDEGVIGGFGLFRAADLPLDEVGYWIGRPYWGRGFASEALAAVVGWATQARRRRALVAGHMVDNPASGAVLCRCGFLYTGVVQSLFSRARDAEAPTRRMIRLA